MSSSDVFEKKQTGRGELDLSYRMPFSQDGISQRAESVLCSIHLTCCQLTVSF